MCWLGSFRDRGRGDRGRACINAFLSMADDEWNSASGAAQGFAEPVPGSAPGSAGGFAEASGGFAEASGAGVTAMLNGEAPLNRPQRCALDRLQPRERGREKVK